MSDISLFKAFSILFKGSDYQIGEGHHWKRGVLTFAMALSAIFPILNFWNSQSYMGAIPPEAPLIRGIGSFTNENYRSRVGGSNISFRSDDGDIYRVMNSDLNIATIGKANSGLRFYVEGFLLRGGDGFFWPTYITSLDGRVLLSREESTISLQTNREPFGGILLWEYGSIAPLWIISLLNAVKLKNKLSVES
ncbi:hypothetical protein SAMN05444172_2794 [Burkholderia sp. GAS332]|nr:hypothetical protein SAMN05444172_2794 [Burkholderia sp. GAS332]